MKEELPSAQIEYEYSREYWSGWILGYSQRILSDKSGVSLRMIQQYEQRAKDINKATGINLLALARTLGCSVEELMEPEIEES